MLEKADEQKKFKMAAK